MPYEESFPAGTWVRIAEREALDEFLRTWKLHNPLKTEQLAFAGDVAEVSTGILPEACFLSSESSASIFARSASNPLIASANSR